LHDRMGATTVYVTHDQLEAMQMGDKIVVMNHGAIEQFGTPQDIYDKPATMFVAEFIGSPHMNFLKFQGSLEVGANTVTLHHQRLGCPVLREPFDGDMIYGVRPEHVRLSDSADYRGEIIATEYLGTTQIVTLNTHNGQIKARINSDQRASIGETVGLDFNAATVTLFDNQTGNAIRSDLNEGVLSHG
ncbi:MAG: ABC transporter ATP-binding protein, partial [Pseudomonadota bacterium]